MMPPVFLILTALSAGMAFSLAVLLLVTRFCSSEMRTSVKPSVNHSHFKSRLRESFKVLSTDHLSPAAHRIRLGISGMAACISLAAGGNIIFAFLTGAGIYALIRWQSGRKKEKDRRVFDDQLIEALGMIATAVRTGQSLMQALETMVKATKPPLSALFNEALAQTRLGLPLSEALTAMTKKSNSDELRIAVTAIVLSRETGGNLGEIMQRIADTMRERKKIQGKIDTLTAQGKASGVIMSLVPAALLILLTLIEPGMYGLLFSTVAGNILLCVATLMVVCGSFFIKKITSIDF